MLIADPLFQKLDDELLSAFMANFFGYGNPHAPLWFIGMEEGGGHEIKNISARLRAWETRDRQRFEDVREFHLAAGICHPFIQPKREERTWGRLIRTVLGGQGRPPVREEILEVQASTWARSTSEVCLAELLPLPSPGVSQWNYGGWSKMPELRTRKAYEDVWKNRRAACLKDLLGTYQPRLVVFFGKSNLRYWEEIAGVHFERTADLDLWLSPSEIAPTWACMLHPAVRQKSEYFAKVGNKLAERVGRECFGGKYA